MGLISEHGRCLLLFGLIHLVALVGAWVRLPPILVCNHRGQLRVEQDRRTYVAKLINPKIQYLIFHLHQTFLPALY